MQGALNTQLVRSFLFLMKVSTFLFTYFTLHSSNFFFISYFIFSLVNSFNAFSQIMIGVCYSFKKIFVRFTLIIVKGVLNKSFGPFQIMYRLLYSFGPKYKYFLGFLKNYESRTISFFNPRLIKLKLSLKKSDTFYAFLISHNDQSQNEHDTKLRRFR